MTGIRVPQLDERRGGGRKAAGLVQREEDVDRIRSFVATATNRRRGPVMTGEPGVANTVPLAAQDAAAALLDARLPELGANVRERILVQASRHCHRCRAACRPRHALASRGLGGRIPEEVSYQSPAEVARRDGRDADLAEA